MNCVVKIGILLFAALFVFAGSPAVAQDVVKIGVVLPITGPLAFDGSLCLKGIQLAHKELNAAGGVTVGGKKYKIELVIEDSSCAPNNSVAAVEKMMTRDKVVAVVGDFCSTSVLADAEVARRHRVLQITPSAVAPNITRQGNPWIFRGCEDSLAMAKAHTAFAIDNLKITRWALLSVNDDYGRSGAEALIKTAKEHGGAEIVAEEYHEKGATDYYSLLTKIKDKKPNGLVLVSNTLESAMKTNQWAELGMNKTMRLMDPTTANFNPKFMELTGKNAEGMIGAARYVWSLENPENKKFAKAFHDEYKVYPEKFSQSSYDCVKMLAQAMERANSVNPEKIRDAMTKTDYTGPQGRFQFTPENQLVLDEYIVEVQKGEFVIIGKVPKEKLFGSSK